MAICGNLNSQTEAGNLILQNNKEIGKINDVKVSLIKYLNIQASNNVMMVRVEYLPKNAKVSDMFVDFKDTTEISKVIASLHELDKSAGIVNENDLTAPHLAFAADNGLTASCYLIYAKTQAMAGSGQAGTNEKVYVKTEEKFYEGKTVFEDGGGTFIWRKVSLSPENATTKDGFIVRGSKEYAVQLQKQVAYSKIIFNSFDFKQFIILLEAAKTKMIPTTN